MAHQTNRKTASKKARKRGAKSSSAAPSSNKTAQSAKAATTKVAPAPVTTDAALKHGDKSEFVRARPHMTAPQVVAEFKTITGEKLTLPHVYNIRSADRKKGVNGAGAASPTVPATPTPAQRKSPKKGAPQRETSDPASEKEFRRLTIRLGIDRAERVITEIKTTLSLV